MRNVTDRSLGPKPRSAPLWRTREALFTDLGVFILGAAGAYSINLIGSLPGDELLVLPLLPVLLLARGRRAFRREYLWFHILVAAWLFGTIAGDIYLDSPITSRAKGIARVVFFAFDFMALAIVINNKTRRIIIFAMSIVAVMLIGMRDFKGEFLTQWKFGGSSALTLVALLISSYFYAKRKYWSVIGISIALAGLNLIFAFRSQIGIDLVSAALILPIFSTKRMGKDPVSRIFGALKFAVLLALAGGSAYLANEAIKLAATQGFFEESIAQKFEGQSNGKLGVFVGGRPETLVAIQAIRDSPIIGHGSFAVDRRYTELKQDIQYENGYTDTDEVSTEEDDSIPAHSHLTMAWVESGILGGLLWIYVLVLTLRAVFRIVFTRPALAPLYCYLLLNFVWDILYSPFGSVNRIWGAYLILLSYNVLNKYAIKDAPVPLKRRAHSHQPWRVRLGAKQPLAS